MLLSQKVRGPWGGRGRSLQSACSGPGTTGGDCIIGGVELTGLSSGGTLAIEITNVPKPGYMVLSKTLPDDAPGSIEGYCFNIHRRAGEGFSAETWRGRTDQNGNIYKTNSSYVENTSPSDADYKFTGLYDGYYDFRELLSMREYKNTKTTKVTFTVTDLNGTQVMQRSYSGSYLSWQDNGDCTISRVHLTGLNGGGRLSITIQNEPIPPRLQNHLPSNAARVPHQWHVR